MSSQPIITVPLTLHTKERLLDAAEHLFAEHGIDGASMRAITQAAGTSVSAANYHFGSKDELVRATFSRRVVAINERRLDALVKLEASTESPTLEQVLGTFLQPILEAQAERIASGGSPQHFQQVAARLFADAPARVAVLRQELFGPLHTRFATAMRQTLPGCSESEAELGLQLTVALLVHATNGHVEGASLDALLAKMITYSAAGIRAVIRSPDLVVLDSPVPTEAAS